MVRRSRTLLLLGFALLAVGAPQAQTGPRRAVEPASVFFEPTSAVLSKLAVAPVSGAKIRNEVRLSAGRAAAPPVVGDRRIWPALDGVNGREYLKYFTLRAIGSHIE